MPIIAESEKVYAGLIVKQGMPYEKDFRFLLQQDKALLGRATKSFKPDIAFSSMLISRQHCCLEQRNGTWMICELGSKHGTLLNGNPLTPGSFYPLKHGDQIGLASKIVLLSFRLWTEDDETYEFTSTQVLHLKEALAVQKNLQIDAAKRSVMLYGQEIELSHKEWSLLSLLYRHKNEVVSYQEIHKAVWPERFKLQDGSTDVGADEMNILLYRLRRKLGGESKKLKTRRGQGCVLECE